jgi:hypothetical protein
VDSIADENAAPDAHIVSNINAYINTDKNGDSNTLNMTILCML